MFAADATIRQASTADIAQLVAIKRRSAAEAYAGADNLDDWLDRSCDPSWFSYRIGRSAYHVFVAEVDGQIVGYSGYRQRGERADGHSVGFYVDPAFQGQGIGDSLLKTRTQHAQAAGCTSMRVAIWRTNEHCKQMMQRRGFIRVRGFREHTTGVMVDHYETPLLP